MSELALLAHPTPHHTVAYAGGRAVTAGQFVADVERLAARLRAQAPRARYLVNALTDRYRFAVAFCAALVAGRVNLLPGSRAPAALAELAAAYPDHVAVTDGELAGGFAAGFVFDAAPGEESAWPPARIARDAPAAVAFTSGSTGKPRPHVKYWGSLVDSALAERAALGIDVDAYDTVLVGTVGPQHMYGLESTVLLALANGLALATEHPLHPHEIAAALAAVRGRRVLVTTPVHLRALIAAGTSLPPLDRIVCATAPLAPELAARCESAFGTRVYEIYGCTETGQIAARRTADGPWWRAFPGVRIEDRDGVFWAGGGHVVHPAPLGDRLLLRDAQTFRLEGRTADLVNVAGKRTSLAALNHALLAVDGVIDGTFFLPDAPGDREPRLVAFVVAPGRTRREILDQLRLRIDPVFLPRPLVLVDRLPRNTTGKLPRAELAALARRYDQGRA
ncbi:MAG TPA: AMP-binding protein [Burkholderiaceae bacterium]|jgi:acyl-coenzyme A synthetase/AMP-(fatty) acid ligase|nr:AMP-binding protein [Burkholderiaceae bacterium]